MCRIIPEDERQYGNVFKLFKLRNTLTAGSVQGNRKWSNICVPGVRMIDDASERDLFNGFV